jgi:HEPN domain-containing protein
MKPLTREWVVKAEGDFHSCLRETRARKHPNHDSACFHAQQCVEKYLKARLQELGAPVPKTHNLEDLLNRLLPLEPQWIGLKADLVQLTNYAVVFRYPGLRASKADAQKAHAACGRVRAAARRIFGLKK